MKKPVGLMIATFSLPAALSLTPACAPAVSGPQRDPSSLVTDDGIAYPRQFSASMQMVDNATGLPSARASYEASDSETVFGCSEQGADFVFYIHRANESLKIAVGGVGFRESKSIYTDLVHVNFLGRMAGLSFDINQQQYQLQSCEARVRRGGSHLEGTFTCHNVVPVGANTQARLDLRFSCEVMPR